MDRNTQRRDFKRLGLVALRKESVDRNRYAGDRTATQTAVALRKESVDRNGLGFRHHRDDVPVALRKESVDRNYFGLLFGCHAAVALRKESVDRNTSIDNITQGVFNVALRKESVDRNTLTVKRMNLRNGSLSARRAWIEISTYVTRLPRAQGRSPQGERG